MMVNGDYGNTDDIWYGDDNDDIWYGDEADDATCDDDSFARAILPLTKCAPPKAYTPLTARIDNWKIPLPPLSERSVWERKSHNVFSLSSQRNSDESHVLLMGEPFFTV